MDSGNDAAENLGILIKDGSWFIVKRNLRRGESKQEWLDKVKECCKDVRHLHDGKTVYIGSSWKDVDYKDSEGNNRTITMRIVYEVIERTTDKDGQFLMIPDIECNTIWTNLGWSDDDIIKGYHAQVNASSITVKSRQIWTLRDFRQESSIPMNWYLN